MVMCRTSAPGTVATSSILLGSMRNVFVSPALSANCGFLFMHYSMHHKLPVRNHFSTLEITLVLKRVVFHTLSALQRL